MVLLAWRVVACGCGGTGVAAVTYGPVPPAPLPSLDGDGVKVGTFLGNYSRRFYGLGPAPKRLEVLWKARLGSGWTSGKYDSDPPGKWAGSGWTGMPNIVVDGGKPYVVVGGYDHRLRRLDAVDRRGRVGVQVRRHHQEQPVGVPEPRPHRRRRQVHRLRRLAPRLPTQARRCRTSRRTGP